MEKKIDQFYTYGLMTINYRRERAEMEFARIRRELEGYGKSVYTNIEDEKGHIDPAKLDVMITDMLDALDRYLEFSEKEPLDDKQREWYRAYLYCVIASPDIDMLWLIPEYISSRCYEDIFKFADFDPSILDMKEFIWNENHEWNYEADVQSDILFYLMHSYCTLTGKHISMTYDEEQKEIYEKLGPALSLSVEDRDPDKDLYEETEGSEETEETHWESKIQMAGAEGYDDEDSVSDDEADDPYDEIPDDVLYEMALQTAEEDQKEYDKKIKSVDRWCEHVGDAKRYEEEYLKFRKLFFTADHARMKEDMKNMVDTYLYEEKISAYTLWDEYSIVSDALNAIPGRIRRAIAKARAMS